MTITQRKAQNKSEDAPAAMNEPGDLYQCDSCDCDLTHTIRIKCADPICETGDGVDICPTCFCAGKEFRNHKRGHAYRVIEINSYPIFTEDWGADEELLLIKGIATQGFGNWKKIAEVVGTRTKEEVEAHYNSTFIESATWPVPPMDRHFEVDPAEFQDRKRRRISAISSAPIPPQKPTPVSLPGIHEIAGFFPGRLEFEHELDNEAEDLVKDLEFGVVNAYGGDVIPEDPNDLDVKARMRWEEERRARHANVAGKGIFNGISNSIVSTSQASTSQLPEVKKEKPPRQDDGEENEEDAVEEVTQPPPIETEDSLAFKLTLLEMYFQRVQKRHEAKSVMYDRGLLEYKKMQAADKKRPREEREILHRLRPFARLQTAEDYEVFSADILYEALLRKRIKELQEYRRLGLVTSADIEKYEIDIAKRTQVKAAPSFHVSDRLQHRAGGRQSLGPEHDRKSHERDSTPKAPIRKQPPPLNLANSPSLHLLTPGEQTLCSSLRILPKPYLVIKETLVREYARRGGKLRRREARDLVKVDVSKTARIWDFLVQTGFLKINDLDLGSNSNAAAASSSGANTSQSSPRPPAVTPTISVDSQPAIPTTGWQPPS